MANPDNVPTYVFTREAVLRSIETLEKFQIHEHFPGYLAILRAQEANQGQPIRSADIVKFHDRYLRVIGAPDRSPYVRPFRSRGRGLETFNSNTAGSYAPSSLRARGALIGVIDVTGERTDAAYRLRDNHERAAIKHLLKEIKIPALALAAFLYRDYGFYLSSPDPARVLTLFRNEFGLTLANKNANYIFDTLFYDDTEMYKPSDLEIWMELPKIGYVLFPLKTSASYSPCHRRRLYQVRKK